jgi:acetolactate synthase-1/3 small subunit
MNRITILFTRRHINIESITASESEVDGIYRYTIAVNAETEQIEKLVKQINKQVEVFKAFYHEESAVIYREMALYKVAATALRDNELFSAVVNKHHAKILSISPDFIIVEKTGGDTEIKKLFTGLQRFGVLEFARSGRVAMTKPMKTLSTYLMEIENECKTTIKHFNNN